VQAPQVQVHQVQAPQVQAGEQELVPEEEGQLAPLSCRGAPGWPARAEQRHGGDRFSEKQGYREGKQNALSVKALI